MERAEQVTMMGQIYARAQEVIIWLGIDMHSGPRSLQSYPGATIPSTADATVTHIMKLLADNKHFHELPIVAHCKAQSCPCTPRGGTHELGDAASVLKALNTVFGSQWFMRAWTVQEIVLAKKATLLLETSYLSWDIAARAWINLSQHMRSCCSECVYSLPGSAADIIYQISCRVLEITEAKQSYESGQHIVQCLLRFNGRECLDPLDKLYGLLALQSSKTPTPITPNYKSSLQELFSRFALDTIATQGWLVPFCLDLEQLKPNLPSWVPDWTVRTKSPMIYAANRFSSSSTYDAAKGFGGELEVDETYTLGLDGIDVG